MVRLIFLVWSVAMLSMSVMAAELPKISLHISNHKLSAEVANTEISRAQGLMFRPSLAKDTGMLFVFPTSAHYGMWMKNTMIPLSVAFINEDGRILNIADMEPYSLTAHHAAGAAKYALEMNQGWFADRDIHAGDVIVGLEQAQPAK